ncbi:MAG: hypothetical protein ACLFP2_03420 [Candidatus Woesearchaeota archaeon]
MGFKTIPYRVGYSNLSYVVESTNHSGAGDAILVTDRSGSMEWVFYQNNDNGNYRDISYEQCTEERLNDPDVSRIYVARCVDKEFSSDMVLSSTYNRVGLASYDSNLLENLPLNDDYPPLKERIEQYEASGGTCTACGVWSGVQSLLQSSNSIIAKMISRNDEWSYYEDFHPGPSWKTKFNESWQTGNAILGSGDVQTLLYTSETPIELWGEGNDSTVDFSSGINMSGSTFHYDLNKSLSQLTIEKGEWTKASEYFTENFSELKGWKFVDLDDSTGTDAYANGKLIHLSKHLALPEYLY